MTTTVTPQGTSQAECALSALPGETPGDWVNNDPDIIRAAGLIAAAFNAVVVAECAICGATGLLGASCWWVSGCEFQDVRVCRSANCTATVYALCANEGFTAVLT